MPQEDLTFRITALAGAADAVFQRLHQHFTKMGSAVKSLNSSMQSQSATMSAMLKGMMGFGALYGLQRGMEGAARGINQAAEDAHQFEEVMTELLFLGNNIKMTGKVKDEVLSLGVAYGTATDMVSSFLFRLQSGGSNLPPNLIRAIAEESLELTKVMGGALDTNSRLVLKSVENFGDGSEEYVSIAQNQIAKISEIADVKPSELEGLADIMPVASLFGAGLPELGAQFATISLLMNDTGKGMTALRNVYMRLGQAAELGVIKPTHDVTAAMVELQGVDPDMMAEIFGHRAVVAAAALAQSTGTTAANIEKIQQAGAANEVEQKGARRLLDPAYAASEIQGAAAMAKDTADLRKDNTWAQQSQVKYNEIMTGWKGVTPPWLRGILGEGVIGTGVAAAANFISGGAIREKGQDRIWEDLWKGGRYDLAEMYNADTMRENAQQTNRKAELGNLVAETATWWRDATIGPPTSGQRRISANSFVRDTGQAPFEYMPVGPTGAQVQAANVEAAALERGRGVYQMGGDPELSRNTEEMRALREQIQQSRQATEALTTEIRSPRTPRGSMSKGGEVLQYRPQSTRNVGVE